MITAMEAAEAFGNLSAFGMTMDEAVRAFSAIPKMKPTERQPPRPRSMEWRCSYCDASNNAHREACHYCGGPR